MDWKYWFRIVLITMLIAYFIDFLAAGLHNNGRPPSSGEASDETKETDVSNTSDVSNGPPPLTSFTSIHMPPFENQTTERTDIRALFFNKLLNDKRVQPTWDNLGQFDMQDTAFVAGHAPTSRKPAQVAMCFYGIFRFQKWRDAWQTTEKTLEQSNFHSVDVFASTWNYVTSYVVTGREKEKRAALRKKLFSDGSVMNHVPSILSKVFGRRFRGAFVGKHSDAERVCSKMICIIALVRAHCLRAIVGVEKRSERNYEFVWVARGDFALPWRVQLTPKPTPKSSPKSSPKPSGVGRQATTATFQIGKCASLYSKRLWPAAVTLTEMSVVVHLAISRRYMNEKERQKDSQLNNVTMGTFKWISDFTVFGFREAVASVLMAAVRHIPTAQSMGGKKNLMSESNLAIALATYAGHVIVQAVHFGYFVREQRKCDIFTPVVMTDQCERWALIPPAGLEKSTNVCLVSFWRKGMGWYSKTETVLAIPGQWQYLPADSSS